MVQLSCLVLAKAVKRLAFIGSEAVGGIPKAVFPGRAEAGAAVDCKRGAVGPVEIYLAVRFVNVHCKGRCHKMHLSHGIGHFELVAK